MIYDTTGSGTRGIGGGGGTGGGSGTGGGTSGGEIVFPAKSSETVYANTVYN